jgi:hypothetical protein
MLSFVLTLPAMESARLCRPEAFQPVDHSDGDSDDGFLTDDDIGMEDGHSDDSEGFPLWDPPSSEPIPIPARWGREKHAL